MLPIFSHFLPTFGILKTEKGIYPRRVMPKPFDVTTKNLVDARPGDWLRFLRLPGTRAEVVDADLATVTTEADRVLRVTDAPIPYLLHLEFQASRDDTLAVRTLRYNVLLDVEYGLPVKSVVFLLRPDAASPTLTGVVERTDPAGNGAYLRFGYDVVRLWEIPAQDFLAGGLATLPLAPLSKVTQKQLPSLIRQMEAQVDAVNPPPAEVRSFWASTYLLMGLRYTPSQINTYLKGIQQLKESSTYQAILAEGREIGREIGIEEGQRRRQRRRHTRHDFPFGRQAVWNPLPCRFENAQRGAFAPNVGSVERKAFGSRIVGRTS